MSYDEDEVYGDSFKMNDYYEEDGDLLEDDMSGIREEEEEYEDPENRYT